MIILKLIIILLLLLMMGLMLEKLFHMSYSLEQLTYKLKTDISKVITALITKEEIRHIFNLQLAEELRNVARPFSNTAFEIDVGVFMDKSVPFVGIHFVPDHVLDTMELNDVSHLLLLKFKRYLSVNNLDWKYYAIYYSGHDFVEVHLYYAEFPKDVEPFNERYRKALKEKTAPDFGLLQDDELNKELDKLD